MQVSIVVTGKVQGVWFRHHTHLEAQKRGLNGYVKNRADGSVYIEVSGDDQMVDELITWCDTGSPLSVVEYVSVEPLEKEHDCQFEIR